AEPAARRTRHRRGRELHALRRHDQAAVSDQGGAAHDSADGPEDRAGAPVVLPCRRRGGPFHQGDRGAGEADSRRARPHQRRRAPAGGGAPSPAGPAAKTPPRASGGPAPRRFRVGGGGNWRGVDRGRERRVRGPKVSPPQVKSNLKTSATGISGTRTWEYVIV